MIQFSLFREPWNFCDRLDCGEEIFSFHPEDAFALRSSLQYSKPESLAMNLLRNLLWRETNGWALARMSEDDAIEQVVHLLIRQRLHVHVTPLKPVAFTQVEGDVSQAAASSPARASQSASSPSRAQSVASDPPTFNSPLDGAIQAAALVAAAAQGQPFCPQ